MIRVQLESAVEIAKRIGCRPDMLRAELRNNIRHHASYTRWEFVVGSLDHQKAIAIAQELVARQR